MKRNLRIIASLFAICLAAVIFAVGAFASDAEAGYEVIANDGTVVYKDSLDGVAVVVWQDANGNEVAVDYYIPGAGVYPTENDGSLVPNIEENARGWYEIGFAGWNETASETELLEAGVYAFTPKMETRLTDSGVPGIKLNLSVYTDYELNVYIPENAPKAVTDVILSTDKEGAVAVRPAGAVSSSTYYAPTSVTIDGAPYTKYIDRFMSADTSVKSYYLVFKVNGETLVQTIEYGVPYYASAVMSLKDAEIGKDSKNLVMNMVNYSDKLLSLLGSAETEGSRIYDALLDKFGTDSGYSYLNAYTELYDERFAEVDDASTDGITNDIYLKSIKDLTYRSASGYIKSASILFTSDAPAFVFEYGNKAVANKNGIKAPGSNGFYSHDSVGIFTYFGYAGDSTNPAAHYAYRGDIYTGTRLAQNDPVWLSNTVAVVDSFGTRYYYDIADQRYETIDGTAYTGKEADLVRAEDIRYYVVTDPYRYGEKTPDGFSKLSALIEPVNISVRSWENGSTAYVAGTGNVTYSLAAYVKAMIDGGEECQAHEELAKALYAYAVAAASFGMACEDKDNDHLCDHCEKELSVCRDGDMDNYCDECGKDLRYKYVVVIGVDGAGSFFAEASTPNIDRIFANGAISYDVLSETPSISAQCWGSILHGVRSGVHGCTNTTTKTNRFPSDSKIPSFLRVVKENSPTADVASFTNWANINYGIVEDGIGIYKGFDDPEVVTTKDADVTAAILAYLEGASPAAMFVQFDEADGAGHGYGFGSETQLNKISLIDGYIGQIYDAYAKKGIIDETLFIVTSDHGGTPTKEGGALGGNHGGDSDAEMYVMFAAAGKTVVPGAIGEMEIRDTAAVVLYALGYDRPGTWTAVVPSGIFEGVEAPDERPVYVDKDSERYHETEPTPELDSDKYVTNFVDKELVHYLPLDGNPTDVVGGLNTSVGGKIYWINSYYGKGATLDDGYISVSDFSFGDDDWTISVMIDTRGASPDPVVLGNKNWKSGRNVGFVLCINSQGKLLFNAGDGTNRVDYELALPEDYRDGYFNVILSFDRQNSRVRLCADFGEIAQISIRESIMDAIYEIGFLNVGQDATGVYYPLSATLDELMFFKGVLQPEDVVGLAEYFGKTVTAPKDPDYVPTIRDLEGFKTPEENSDGHINSYVTKYIGKDLVLYMPFDGNANAATGNATTATNGIRYEKGFFGEAVRLENGEYIAVNGVDLGADSKTFAFWYKTDISLNDDPPILAGKSWSGAGAGFVIATNQYNRIWFNLGNGSTRLDVQADLPSDYAKGWVHVIVSVDRENAKVKIYLDFAEAKSGAIPEALLEQVLSTVSTLYVGNEGGSSKRENALDAALDELMIFNGAFTENDVRALSKYFGVEALAYGDVVDIPKIEEKEDPTLRAPGKNETPKKDSDAYIGNFISDKELSVYLTFDGTSAAETSQATSERGTMSYEDGVFGESLRLQGGNRVTVEEAIGTGSTTYAFWIKLSEAPTTDVIILASKKWSGAVAGFAIATSQWKDIRFNLGNGSKSHYTNGVLPADAYDGWMHVMIVVDREESKVRLYLDFKEVATTSNTTNDLPDTMADQALASVLYIGNCANNSCSALNAAIDELMIFDGALSADDARALSRYYGVESFVFE